jgi:hypothetical protein
MSKKETIVVQGTAIILYERMKSDYISITDIVRYRDLDEKPQYY